jgi:hypothetical protein
MFIDLTHASEKTVPEGILHKIYRTVMNYIVPVAIMMMFLGVLSSNIKVISGLSATGTTKTLFGMSFIVLVLFLLIGGKIGWDWIQTIQEDIMGSTAGSTEGNA